MLNHIYTLHNILNVFRKYIDLDKIIKKEYNHIHPNLKSSIEDWLNLKSIKKTYDIYQREWSINDIID